MNGPIILQLDRQGLAESLLQWREDIPRFDPLPINPWLAMSLLQKAVRRGEEGWALRAAATLLKDAPSRLWRRLGVIAYEDVGLGDLEAVGLTTAALTGKRYRDGIGGEWAVASFIVHRLIQAPKCRATDDLVVVCEWHPDLERARLDLTFQPIPDLLKVAGSDAPLPERALALWYALGTHRYPADQLRTRRGEPETVLDALCEQGWDNGLIEVCRAGLKKTGTILPALLILLREAFRDAPSHTEPDDLPDVQMVGHVPGWAYDTFTREGKAALRTLLASDAEIAAWAETNMPERNRTQILGGMLFRVESGLVNNRLRWEIGDRLRHMADVSDYGLNPEVSAEGLALLRKELPLLQDIRRSVVGSNLR